LVIETILNGGVIPEHLQEEDPELGGLDNLVGLQDNPEADEAII
jgi:hypothetical protein